MSTSLRVTRSLIPACRKPVGGGVVDVDELEVRRVSGTAAQQLELDVADAATNLEDGGAFDAVAGDELDDAGRRLVQAAFAVPGGEVSREPGSEHVVASAGVAASGHVRRIRRVCLVRECPLAAGGSRTSVTRRPGRRRR
jgi:hypothetical protein